MGFSIIFFSYFRLVFGLPGRIDWKHPMADTVSRTEDSSIKAGKFFCEPSPGNFKRYFSRNKCLTHGNKAEICDRQLCDNFYKPDTNELFNENFFLFQSALPAASFKKITASVYRLSFEGHPGITLFRENTTAVA